VQAIPADPACSLTSFSQMKLGAAQRAERCSVLPAHIVARARLVKQMAHERQHTVSRHLTFEPLLNSFL
jgi:hypothetical protein